MFNEALKEARIKKKWSQERLARHLEVSLQTVRNWESGRAVPVGYNIEATAKFISDEKGEE